MSIPVVEHTNAKPLFPSESSGIRGIPNLNQESGNLIDAFPQELVNALGRGYLEKVTEIRGTKPVSFDLMPESGAIKGIDSMGRLFVAFVVRNPNYKSVESKYQWGIEQGYPVEEMIITLSQEASPCDRFLQAILDFPESDPTAFIFQRYYAKDVSGMTLDQIYKLGLFTKLGHLTHLPTNDPRLLSAHPLGKEQYEAIKEIFEGRHKDLRLVNLFSQSLEDKLRRKEQELDPWMDRPKVAAILDSYREELTRPHEQFSVTQKV
jgi:hypothetical protein